MTSTNPSPRILIFTGDGKGKTTAALGMVLRASGHGLRALVVHFLKNDASVGELAGLAKLGTVEAHQVGKGFVPPKDSPHYCEHRHAAEKGFALLQRRTSEAEFDLIVLDEICGAISCGLIETQTVREWIATLDASKIVVLTGRNAPDELIAAADTVSEIREVKHAYQSNIPATPGIEF